VLSRVDGGFCVRSVARTQSSVGRVFGWSHQIHAHGDAALKENRLNYAHN
jgi:hypothetical protein